MQHAAEITTHLRVLSGELFLAAIAAQSHCWQLTGNPGVVKLFAPEYIIGVIAGVIPEVIAGVIPEVIIGIAEVAWVDVVAAISDFTLVAIPVVPSEGVTEEEPAQASLLITPERKTQATHHQTDRTVTDLSLSVISSAWGQGYKWFGIHVPDKVLP